MINPLTGLDDQAYDPTTGLPLGSAGVVDPSQNTAGIGDVLRAGAPQAMALGKEALGNAVSAVMPLPAPLVQGLMNNGLPGAPAAAASPPPGASPPPLLAPAPAPSPAAPGAPPSAPSAPKKPGGAGAGTAAPGALAGINAAETAAAGALGTAKVAQAGAIAAGKQDEVTARQKLIDDEQTRINAKTEALSKVNAEAAADSDAAKKAGFRGYWADKSAGTKILAAISVALGGLGQAFQAKAGRPMGENQALQIINSAIAQDWQQQKEMISKLERQAEKSGADARHISAEVGLMQAAHAKNALDLSVAQAEQRVAALGPQVAQAANAGLLAGLRREQFDAEKKLEVQKAQVAEMRAGTALKYAEANKANAEAGAKANDKSSPAKGITDARQRAMVAAGLEDQDRIAKALEVKGVKLDEKDRQRIQDNRTYLKAAAEGKGAADAFATVLLRRYGTIPRGEFDGLTPDKKQLAGTMELMSQKAALLASGSQTSEAINHARGLVDLLAPGLGPQEQARRRQYIRADLIGANVGLVPGEVEKARAGAAAAGGEATPTAAPKVSPEDKTRLIQFIRQNPNDPRSARARQLLGIGGAGQVAGL